MPIKPWSRFRVGTPSTRHNWVEPKCQAFGEVAHVTHIPNALTIPVRCVGGWSYDKIYRLVKYFGIFASGMKNAWKGLNYVEICSGPGRCIIRDQRTEMDGTARSIITHPVFPKASRVPTVPLGHSVCLLVCGRINRSSVES
jgi:hypothetical protein